MIEGYYATIAQELHAHCPSGYTKAWLDAEVDDSSADQGYFCQVGDEQVQPDVPVGSSVAITKALVSLRSEMSSPGQRPWNRCTFTLQPDGTFNLDVSYDD